MRACRAPWVHRQDHVVIFDVVLFDVILFDVEMMESCFQVLFLHLVFESACRRE